MFCNKFNHTVDDKGRLIVPMEYREELSGQNPEEARLFYITTNLWDPSDHTEPCLCLWPEKNYMALREKLAGISGGDEKIRRIKRRFFSSTQSSLLDKQGRVLIIPELKDYAGIVKNVMLVGADDHIEVWDYDAWSRYLEADDEENSAWNETLASLGF